MGVMKKLKAPAKRQGKRVEIMGRAGVQKQDRRRLKAGGHKAKETVRRVGEYKAAVRKKTAGKKKVARRK
jgi:hypothetical protein